MKDVKALLNSQAGQPYSLITLSGDRDAMLGYYLSHGFDQAQGRGEAADGERRCDEDGCDAECDRGPAGVRGPGAALGHRAHQAEGGGQGR